MVRRIDQKGQDQRRCDSTLTSISVKVASRSLGEPERSRINAHHLVSAGNGSWLEYNRIKAILSQPSSPLQSRWYASTIRSRVYSHSTRVRPAWPYRRRRSGSEAASIRAAARADGACGGTSQPSGAGNDQVLAPLDGRRHHGTAGSHRLEHARWASPPSARGVPARRPSPAEPARRHVDRASGPDPTGRDGR